jgi:hypothetical protein
VFGAQDYPLQLPIANARRQFNSNSPVDKITPGIHDSAQLLSCVQLTRLDDAGLLDIGALVVNPVSLTPSYISLPSEFNNTSITRTVTLRYDPGAMGLLATAAAGTGSGADITASAAVPVMQQPLRFRVGHERAAAIMVPTTWGARPLTPFDDSVFDAGAAVRFTPPIVTLGPGEEATVQARLQCCTTMQ